MIKKLKAWFAKRQRAIDMQTLWPACKVACLKHNRSMDEAKVAFATHAFSDKAWTNHMTHEEIKDFITALK